MTIDSISNEKWEELVRHREQCIKIGSATEPADWAKAEEAITKLYRKMDWNSPITFHRVASPKAAQELMKEQFGAKETVDTNLWGCMDIYWIGYLQFLASIDGVEADQDKLELLEVWGDIANSISWWYVVDETTCIMCDRPAEVHWNDSGVLHCETDMAVKFRDGWGLYSYEGVRIPKNKSFIITNPEQITVETINSEENAEIKRIMSQQMGINKFLDESGAEVVHMDMVKVYEEGGEETMPRALVRDKEGRQFLVGTDGSTMRIYYMEVSPETTTCVEAHNSISPFDESLIEGNS